MALCQALLDCLEMWAITTTQPEQQRGGVRGSQLAVMAFYKVINMPNFDHRAPEGVLSPETSGMWSSGMILA